MNSRKKTFAQTNFLKSLEPITIVRKGCEKYIFNVTALSVYNLLYHCFECGLGLIAAMKTVFNSLSVRK